ncbi:MAG: putative LPS assembly protein LptD [Cyclobacteriaceae bacterium]
MNFSLKAKHLEIKPEGVGKYIFFIFFLTIQSFLSTNSLAQVETTITEPAALLPVAPDTVGVPVDSLLNKNDTLNIKSPSRRDSVPAPAKSDIETTIYYSARDSINSNLSGKLIRLYGEAKIKYGEIELEADEIEIDYEKSTISARGSTDSLGQRVGFPIFKNGPEVYETRDMVYNFKTEKAQISEVVTQQGDGFVHGDLVYKNDKNELFTVGNAYTTCNLAHPHFRIISKKAKAIPDDKIVTGPFYMEVNDVPTPLGFAFGMFPAQKQSSSGIIVPSYGEEKNRGFFLKNGGYFFDISDYLKLTLTGDIFSKGSSALYLNSLYRKRYAYDGTFNFSTTSNRINSDIENRDKIRDYRIMWTHSPQSKGTGRFSASVNAATSTYTTNNLLPLNSNPASNRLDNTSRQLSSNISYSKTFAGTPMSLGVNMRHSQDLVTQKVNLLLPDFNFNVNNIYPFKKASDNEFLENFVIRYTMKGTNQIDNNLGKIGDATTDSIAPFNAANFSTFLANSKKGIRHNLPIGSSVKLLKHFTLSPSINYDEIWYVEKLDWALDDSGQIAVVVDTISQFNRITNYSGGVNLNTRLYGMYLMKNPNSRVKAIRHVINPSIGYNYRPDYADPKFNYYQTFTTSQGSVIQKSRHEGFVFGSSGQGESSSMNFSLGNTVEMKVKNPADSVAKKVSLLNSLSISSGYNFAADSFKLSPFALGANTNVLNDKININITSILDPYQYRIDSIGKSENDFGRVYETKISRFAWQDGFNLGQITSLNLAFSTNLSPKGQSKDNETRSKIANANISETNKQYLLNNPDAYIDFDVPWNLRLSYNLDYRKMGSQPSQVTQTIRVNGDLSLTEKWKITYNTGYDFDNKEFTQTYLTINRDLHCWQVSLGWTPFGPYQSYNFSIGVKSGMLRDLKLDRTRNFFDN